jgi:hypothetical protein
MAVNLIVTVYVNRVNNTYDRTDHIRLKIEEGSSTGLFGVWDTVNIPDIQVRLHSFFFLNSNRNQIVQNWKRIFQNQCNKTNHITTQWLVCSPWVWRIVDSIRVVVSHRPYFDRSCSYIARLLKCHMVFIKATPALIFLFALHLYKFVFLCRAYDSMGAYSFAICPFIRSSCL